MNEKTKSEVKQPRKVSISAVERTKHSDDYRETIVSEWVGNDPRRGFSPITTDVGTKRLYDGCLYPQQVTFDQYYRMYSRNNVAARVIETFPNYTWNVLPSIIDAGGTGSRFSKRANLLMQQQLPLQDGLSQTLITSLKQLDVLGGIGGEGLLVFGFADGRTMDQPVKKKSGMKIEFIKILHNGQFKKEEIDDDENSPTYGDVITYKTKSFKTSGEINFENTIAPGKIIHASRCVHFKESTGLAYGTSRIQKCYNQLLDIVKVSGASAEVYWLGAFSGLSVETDADTTMDDPGREAMEEGIRKYFNGLARSLLFEGAKAKLLYPAIVSPKEHFDLQISMVSIASEIPRRFLTGAEAAKLASQQDSINWMDRVMNRREQFVGPKVVSPVIQRCIDAGVLPEPKGSVFTVLWPRTQSLPLNDRAEAAQLMTEAVAQYFSSGIYTAMDFQSYLVGICGYGELEALEISSKVDLKKYVLPQTSTSSSEGSSSSSSTSSSLKRKAKEDKKNKVTITNLESDIEKMNARLNVMETTLTYVKKEIDDAEQ